MTMFTNRLDYSGTLAKEMYFLNDLGQGISHVYNRYPLAYEHFTTVLNKDIPELDAPSDGAVELEFSKAGRERSWIKCLAAHGLTKLEGVSTSDYREEIERAKQGTALLLNLPVGATPRSISAYLYEIHDEDLRQDTRTMFSEHARTIFTMGRMTVLKQLMDGEIAVGKTLSVEERKKVTVAQKDFGRNGAYGFARLGNQSDVLLDITADGVRAEAAKGGKISSAHAAIWLGRELGAVASSILNGPAGEKVDSLGILKETVPLVFSQRRAAESISTHP